MVVSKSGLVKGKLYEAEFIANNLYNQIQVERVGLIDGTKFITVDVIDVIIEAKECED